MVELGDGNGWLATLLDAPGESVSERRWGTGTNDYDDDEDDSGAAGGSETAGG